MKKFFVRYTVSRTFETVIDAVSPEEVKATLEQTEEAEVQIITIREIAAKDIKQLLEREPE